MIALFLAAHLEASSMVEAATRCVKPEYTQSAAYWVNSCRYPVRVAWCQGEKECNTSDSHGYTMGGTSFEIKPGGRDGFYRTKGEVHYFACPTNAKGAPLPFVLTGGKHGVCEVTPTAPPLAASTPDKSGGTDIGHASITPKVKAKFVNSTSQCVTSTMKDDGQGRSRIIETNECNFPVVIWSLVYNKDNFYQGSFGSAASPGKTGGRFFDINAYDDSLFHFPDSKGKTEIYFACADGDSECISRVQCVYQIGGVSADQWARGELHARWQDIYAAADQCQIQLGN